MSSCSNCKRVIPDGQSQGGMCHACYMYEYRHGEPRPSYLFGNRGSGRRTRHKKVVHYDPVNDVLVKIILPLLLLRATVYVCHAKNYMTNKFHYL